MKRIVSFVLAMLTLGACSKEFSAADRSFEKVCILYLNGYNNLSGDLEANLKTIRRNVLPMKNSREALVAVSQSTASHNDYTTPTSPVILQLTSDWNGNAVVDTVKKYEKGELMANSEFLEKALLDVSRLFPAKSYGALFSSHGTGWLPEMYYNNAKSFGCDGYYDGSALKSHEIELGDFARSLPYHLDYLIFDACLMGSVEVAYQLRKCAGRIMSSPCEVSTGGFDYKSLTDCLLRSYPSDIVGYAEKYHQKYITGSGATVSVVESSKMENLALVCKDIFGKYHSQISGLECDDVQAYADSQHRWFFDLRDILVKCGIGQTDLDRLDTALREAVIYEAHTQYFHSIKINTSCGLSMFLPSAGSDWLKGYYSTLEWNKATELLPIE